MTNTCKKCGKPALQGYDLCMKCKSDSLFPDCDDYENKMMVRHEVPYCNHYNKRVLAIKAGVYYCKVCKRRNR